MSYKAKNSPDLSRKPDWANFWAQDEQDWLGHWYEKMPHCIEADRGQGVWISQGGRTKSTGKMPPDAMGWAYSLVKIEGEHLVVMRTH